MFRDFNHKLIVKILGSLLVFEGGFLLVALAVSLIYKEAVWLDFLLSAAIAFVAGVTFMLWGEMRAQYRKREVSVIVTNTGFLFTRGVITFFI
jgi:trk system potassium uptake protein TrkH